MFIDNNYYNIEKFLNIFIKDLKILLYNIIYIMSEEIWKEVKDYPGYFVSNKARVKSTKRKNEIFVSLVPRSSYLCVSLYDMNGDNKLHQIHRLVAGAFLDNPNNLPIVDHIDRNKDNNKLENLRWVNASDSCKNTTKKVKKVCQYDNKNNLIKEWESIDEIIKSDISYNRNTIINACSKNIKCYGYIWKYSENKKKIEIEDDEIFKEIGMYKGYDFSNYEVSNYGNIQSSHTDKLRSISISSSGYPRMTLTDKITKKRVTYDIHVIVATLFLDNPNNYGYVNHKDENKKNNHVDNLEWINQMNNLIHSRGTRIAKVDIKTGNVLKVYNSLSEANQDMGKQGTEISICCRGKDNRQTVYGYKWKYI